MALLELKNVKKTYQQGKIDVKALRGVNLSIEPGEFTTVFGPSGSGKTTLLNMIGCLDVPTEGDIYLDKNKVNDLNKTQLAYIRRYNIGFIFQGYNLIPVLTAYENIEFALRLIHHLKDEEIRQKVMDILEAVGLKGKEKRRPNELSGGEKQRVAIARALVKEPKLVLADEPTANIDSKTSQEVLQVMRDMNQKLDTTFIFSTHDPRIMEYAKRLINLTDGIIAEDKKK